MERNDIVGCYIGVSQAWFSVNTVWLVGSQRKRFIDPDDDDLQDPASQEIGKPKILNIVCAMINFENTDKDNTEEWPQSCVCDVGFQHDILSKLMQNGSEKKRVGIMRVKFILP